MSWPAPVAAAAAEEELEPAVPEGSVEGPVATEACVAGAVGVAAGEGLEEVEPPVAGGSPVTGALADEVGSGLDPAEPAAAAPLSEGVVDGSEPVEARLLDTSGVTFEPLEAPVVFTDAVPGSEGALLSLAGWAESVDCVRDDPQLDGVDPVAPADALDPEEEHVEGATVFEPAAPSLGAEVADALPGAAPADALFGAGAVAEPVDVPLFAAAVVVGVVSVHVAPGAVEAAVGAGRPLPELAAPDGAGTPWLVKML